VQENKDTAEMLVHQILLGNGPLFSYTFVTSVSPKQADRWATKEIKYLDLLPPLRLQFSGSNWLFLSLISLDRHRRQGF